MSHLTTVSTGNQSESREWVDRLFLRLASLYGNLWTQRWEGLDLALVKADWHDELRFYSFETIKAALDHCRSAQSLPPTLPEFSRICRDWRRPEAKPLRAHPRLSVDSSVAREKITELVAQLKDRPHDPLNCFREILVEAERGDYTYALGIKYAKEALGLIKSTH